MPNKTGNDVSIFTYTEGKAVICLCGLDRQQAITVLGVLEQGESRRFECGAGLANCLDQLKAQGQYIPKAMIQVAVKSAAGIVAESRPPIPGRVAIFLMRCCASANEPGLDLLKSDLRDFIAGAPATVSRPFAKAEFRGPIKI